MRSDPLILNKKGRLKYPVFCQKGKKRYRWLLVITDFEGRNRGKKVRRYDEAKAIIEQMKETHPDYEYTIVSRQVGYGPPVSKVSDEVLEEQNERGRFWCAYCRKFRVFDEDPFWGKRLCPVCRVPDDSWHVVVNNPLLSRRMWG